MIFTDTGMLRNVSPTQANEMMIGHLSPRNQEQVVLIQGQLYTINGRDILLGNDVRGWVKVVVRDYPC